MVASEQGVTRQMGANMSEKAQREGMIKLRSRYRKAGTKYGKKLIDRAVELMNCHRESAIRAPGADPRTQPATEQRAPSRRHRNRNTAGAGDVGS